MTDYNTVQNELLANRHPWADPVIADETITVTAQTGKDPNTTEVSGTSALFGPAS